MKLCDWRVRLYAIVREAETATFSWQEGRTCAWFAGRCAEAQTGRALDAPYATRFRDAGEARRLLQDGLAERVAELFAEIPPAFAQEGDIAVIPTPETGCALGIFLGERIGVLSEKGYATVARALAIRAFRVE